MKLWLTPVPSRLARPIVSVLAVRPVDVAGVDRDAARVAGAGDEALVDAACRRGWRGRSCRAVRPVDICVGGGGEERERGQREACERGELCGPERSVKRVSGQR